jgi:hypothetical protein
VKRIMAQAPEQEQLSDRQRIERLELRVDDLEVRIRTEVQRAFDQQTQLLARSVMSERSQQSLPHQQPS